MGSPQESAETEHQQQRVSPPGDVATACVGSAESEQGELGGEPAADDLRAPGAERRRQAPLTGNALQKHVLDRLQQLVLQRRQEIQELEQERRDLRVRVAALHLAIRHCNATLELAAAMAHHSSCAAGPTRFAAPLLELKRHLASSAGDEPPPEAASVPLGWGPEAAALAAAAGEFDLTPCGMEARMRKFNKEAGLRIGRVSRRAPNAAQALQELEQLREDLLNYAAVYAIVATAPASQQSMWRAFMVVMDAPEAGKEGQAQAPPPPPPEHWRWAVQQVGFDPPQEDLVRALLAIWRGRAVALARETERHLSELERLTKEAPDDTDGQEALLAKAHNAQATHNITHVVIAHAIYGSVMRAEQAAAWAVGAHPYVPSLASLEEGLQRAHDAQRQPALHFRPQAPRGKSQQ